MALSVTQIFQASGNSVLAALNKPYHFTEVWPVPNHPAYFTYLIDNETGTKIPITWMHSDEIKQVTEADKINFVRALMHNAIDCMKDLLAEQNKVEELEDVNFETPNN